MATALLALVSGGILAVDQVALAVPGALDQTFSRDGKVRIRTLERDYGMALAIDAYDRIVVAGRWRPGFGYDGKFEIVRLRPRGSLDTTFSRDGIRRINFGPDYDGPTDLAIQPDGKIIVAGWTYVHPHFHFAVARLNPNGALDATFGGDGKVTINFPWSSVDSAEGVAVQRDGKIVVVGSSDLKSSLARLWPRGGLDRTFGAGGLVVSEFAVTDSAKAVVPLRDGRLIVGGSDYVLRYLSDGTLDTSFGDGGRSVDPPGPAGCSDTVVQPDGKIVCSTYWINNDSSSKSIDVGVIRWRADGQPDATFGQGGAVSTNVEQAPTPDTGGSSEEAYGVALQRDGKIVIAGRVYSRYTPAYAGDGFLIIRYTSTGALDMAFGEGGIVRTLFTGYLDGATDVAIQSDGKIVAAGDTEDVDFAVTRYMSE
jgi:uncharacterized delta-60 repeat protein